MPTLTSLAARLSAALALTALAGCPGVDVVPDPPSTREPAPEPPAPSPAPLRPQLSETELQALFAASPVGRFAAGDRREGALDLMDPAACARAPIETAFLLATPPLAVRLLAPADSVMDRIHGSPRPLLVGPAAAGMRRTADALLGILRTRGDADVLGRHVCFGLATFESPNANSNAMGYLVFDAQLLFDVNANPGRTLYSSDAIVAHELAHQLQYWTGEPALGDTIGGLPYARRAELEADCVAAALLTVRTVGEVGGENWDRSKSGVRAAVAAVGDLLVEDGGHHGTPGERDRAAAMGLVIGQRTLLQPLDRPSADGTAQALLGACRAYIDGMDDQFSHPWPDSAPYP